MNPQSLLEQFLGPDTASSVGTAVQSGKDKVAGSGLAGVAGGVAAGGLIGLLLGNKKARKTVGKVAGGAVGYGGAAALGALAYRAYNNWQSGKAAPAPGAPAPGAPVQQAPGPQASDPQTSMPQTRLPQTAPQQTIEALPADSAFRPEAAPASDGKPFELALVMAMIAAANADGHITPDEQRMIFDKVGNLPLDAEDKGFVFDALAKPPSLQDIAKLAQGPEQAAELYLVSRLVTDPDDPIEKTYLDALAHRLNLPGDLVGHLDSQAVAVTV